ncbi:MAG TPA: FKBP-type peptidyl-prolyl cis-trans isomerase [Phaeodactylibacter sp.]|nr:FKBP-type peptidyl-prolyl cis-trans isomerase [Phaeodactylibacter sp.]
MKAPVIKTFEDSVSYAYGFLIGQQMKEVGNVDKELLKRGVDDQFGGKPIFTQEQAQDLMRKNQQKKQREQKKIRLEQAKQNIAIEKKFLAQNAKKKGVGSTPSGLQYEILKEGTGKKPSASDRVTVHYEGKLLDGTVFDSSYKRNEPATFALQQVIKGWTEGLQLMKTGAKYRFYIPAKLAYGEGGQRGIPPNSLLIFDVELLQIVDKN